MEGYLVYDVDKRLNITILETIHYINHLLVREDGPNEGGEFTPGDGTADQALQGLIIGVENG
jgi:hypothetical protein